MTLFDKLAEHVDPTVVEDDLDSPLRSSSERKLSMMQALALRAHAEAIYNFYWGACNPNLSRGDLFKQLAECLKAISMMASDNDFNPDAIVNRTKDLIGEEYLEGGG